MRFAGLLSFGLFLTLFVSTGEASTPNEVLWVTGFPCESLSEDPFHLLSWKGIEFSLYKVDAPPHHILASLSLKTIRRRSLAALTLREGTQTLFASDGRGCIYELDAETLQPRRDFYPDHTEHEGFLINPLQPRFAYSTTTVGSGPRHVYVVDLIKEEIVKTLRIGRGVTKARFVLSPDKRWTYVISWTPTLLDNRQQKIARTIPLQKLHPSAGGVRDLTVSQATGELYLATYHEGEIFKLNPAHDQVMAAVRLPTAFSVSILLARKGDILYAYTDIANRPPRNTLWILKTESLQILKEISLPLWIRQLVYAEHRQRLWLVEPGGKVQERDPSTGAFLGYADLPFCVDRFLLVP